MKRRNVRRLQRLAGLLGALLITVLPATAAFTPSDVTSGFGGETVTVFLNGKCIYEEAPLIVHDTTYVSAAVFREAVGDPNAQIAASGNTLTAAGRAIYLPYGAITYRGETYLPVRALAALYGADVAWDAYTSTAYITNAAAAILAADHVYDSEDLYWLSRIIYAESGAEPLLGQIAVGTVVMNRCRSSEYPDSIRGVIFDRKYGVQFTPTANGMIYRTPSERSVLAAKMTLEGYSVSGRILYFIQEALASNRWVPLHCTFVMKIGCHDFYA